MKFDKFIDELDDLTANDAAMDKLVMWMCIACAVACVGILVVG